MTDHDGLYHQLYSHPHMMADLLRQFVNEPWVADLDLSGMEPVRSKYHLPGFPKREGDLIWRIPRGSDADLYLLVLLEFQSESDRWMVLRVMVYMCLLWLQLLHEKKIPPEGPLPPLFPVVLYNGDSPWLMPVRMRDLIHLPKDSPLWAYQPDGKFLLIDEGRYPRDDLENRDSLSALVFLVEQCTSLEDLPALVKAIIEWLDKHPEFVEIKKVLAAMLLNSMAVLGGDQPPSANSPLNLLEVPTMLQTRMEAWKNQKEQEWHAKWLEESLQKGLEKGIEKGLEKGIEKGLEKGRQEGEAASLLRLLQRRFGSLPGWVPQRVHSSDQPTLESWGDRILDAQSLEDVFLDRV